MTVAESALIKNLNVALESFGRKLKSDSVDTSIKFPNIIINVGTHIIKVSHSISIACSSGLKLLYDTDLVISEKNTIKRYFANGY